MKAIAEMTYGRRWAVCAALLALSLLLIGAGRMNGEIRGRMAALSQAKDECRAAAETLGGGASPESRSGWNALAQRSPQTLIMASATSLSPLKEIADAAE